MKLNALKSLSGNVIVYFNMYSVFWVIVLCNALCTFSITFTYFFMIEKSLDIHRDVFWNNVLNQKSLFDRMRYPAFNLTSRVPVEGKSSVCAISVKYRCIGKSF